MDQSEKEKQIEQAKNQSYNRYHQLLDLSLKITDDYNISRRLDVQQLRTVLGQISILSFAIIGFSVPILHNSKIIKTPLLFISALFLLAVSAITSLWYLALNTENSLLNALKGYDKNKEEVRKAMQNEIDLMWNKTTVAQYVEETTELHDQLKKQPKLEIKRDKILYLLLTLFSLATFLILLSFFKITFQDCLNTFM